MATTKEAGIIDSVVVDSDGHITEPDWIWAEYMEPKFRDRAPRVVKMSDGTDWVLRDPRDLGAPWPTRPLQRLGRTSAYSHAAGLPWHEYARRPFTDGRKGAWDPHERIKDMDLEGLDIAVLYPTMCLLYHPDAEFFAARCRAYNNWLADYCKPYPKRLYGIGAIPASDPYAAILEMRRCVKELGFKGVVLRPNAYLENEPYFTPTSDPRQASSYDPIWLEAQEMQVPIGFHPFGSAGAMPGAGRDMGLYKHPYLALTQGLTSPIDMLVTISYMTVGGVLERFPRLKLLFLEFGGGMGWTLLERMDHHCEIWRSQVSHLKMKPSEYFQRNCTISFDVDEFMLKPTAQRLGADRIVWGSDYPHPDAIFPGSVEAIRENIAGLPAADQRLILGLNACKLYNVEPVKATKVATRAG